MNRKFEYVRDRMRTPARGHHCHWPGCVRKVPLETLAICEGAELASDPGWDAERAWHYSETRRLAVAAREAELERRK